MVGTPAPLPGSCDEECRLSIGRQWGGEALNRRSAPSLRLDVLGQNPDGGSSLARPLAEHRQRQVLSISAAELVVDGHRAATASLGSGLGLLLPQRVGIARGRSQSCCLSCFFKGVRAQKDGCGGEGPCSPFPFSDLGWAGSIDAPVPCRFGQAPKVGGYAWRGADILAPPWSRRGTLG